MKRARTILLVLTALVVLTMTAPAKEKTEAVKPVVAGQVVKMKVTAYCPCEKCCGKWALRQAQGKRTTATGDDAYVCDGVAADFELLPKRTLLEIPGAGVKEVDDTGGAMRKAARQNPPVYHIDLRFPTHKEALKWGVKWLEVRVLPKTERRSVR